MSLNTQGSLYKGSCHCGFLTYTAKLDFTAPTPTSRGTIVTKCNCAICVKTGSILADPGPDGLTLLTPAEGELALGDYTFNTKQLHHMFCPKCGIKCYIRGKWDDNGTVIHVVRVNILTLDGKADGTPMEDLREMKLKYWNAKSDMHAPAADEPYEGGFW